MVVAEAASAQTSAAPFAPSAVFVQAGGAHRARQATVGLAWNWDRRWKLGSGRLEGRWEAWGSVWSYPDEGGSDRTQLTQIGVVPVLRWRGDEGRSPWFVEGGIGVSLTDRLYRSEGKQFSTSFNFADHVGVGRSFGSRRQHELALRYEHDSNADIKKPNPGEDFVQLRYTFVFD